MALKKEIISDNGVPLSYHRVVSVNNITNVQSIIEIGSYVSEDERNREIELLSYNKDNPHNTKAINVFINSTFVSIPYDENLNVVNAYDYLKDLDMFKDAEDI